MRNNGVLYDSADFDRLCCLDSCTKTFPVYKHFVTKYQFIPGKPYPCECFSIKSYHLAVKSQQLGIVGNRKSCSEQYNATSCCFRRPDPSHGFQLIEYADKCCSELELPVKECCDKECLSKAIVTDCCKCCDKSVNCDLITASRLQSKVLCLTPPCKPSCLKTKSSSVNVHNKSSCADRKSSFKEIILCRKCKEKRDKKRCEKCRCRSGSVVYYRRKCECVKSNTGGRCVDDSCSKLDCKKYKCKYLDLIQRIKCIFTKER
ncbi:hypothetical protein Zmor_006768 [Zophobas morio]|uniref:Uncharacterized protein n=1 Tax=Zophobas morio TaxID=2755281 RepID=A0AA38IVI6_9CUCU|nr:hypothetical protein Zmor_006768 [Zophobas morio]